MHFGYNSWIFGLLLSGTACTPDLLPLPMVEGDCAPRLLEGTEVRVRRLFCGDELLQDADGLTGQGSRGDWIL